MTVETHDGDVWLKINDEKVPPILHNNALGLYFKRFEFPGGLDSPLAFVVYQNRHSEKENFLRFDIQKRAFASEFTEEFSGAEETGRVREQPFKEISAALLTFLEDHSSELTSYFFEQQSKMQDKVLRRRKDAQEYKLGR